MKETLDNNPKWQDKVQAVNLFIQFLRSEGSNHSECGESAIVFAKHFSKEFKAANMNILKCCLDCVKAAIETCGAGPRACGSVVVGLVPKVCVKRGIEYSFMIANWVPMLVIYI